MSRPMKTEWFYDQTNLKHLSASARCILYYVIQETLNGELLLEKTLPEMADDLNFSTSTVKNTLKFLERIQMVQYLPWNGRARKIKLVSPTLWKRKYKKLLVS